MSCADAQTDPSVVIFWQLMVSCLFLKYQHFFLLGVVGWWEISKGRLLWESWKNPAANLQNSKGSAAEESDSCFKDSTAHFHPQRRQWLFKCLCSLSDCQGSCGTHMHSSSRVFTSQQPAQVFKAVPPFLRCAAEGEGECLSTQARGLCLDLLTNTNRSFSIHKLKC